MTPSHPITVSTPRTTILAVGLGGVLCLALGLYLVLVGLPKDYPIRLNGWVFLIFGAVLSYAGVHALLIHAPYLVIDEEGLHLPKYQLSVAWPEIKGARRVAVKNAPPFVVLSLTEPERFAVFKAWIEKFKFDLGPLGEKEVPLPLFGKAADCEKVFAVLCGPSGGRGNA